MPRHSIPLCEHSLTEFHSRYIIGEGESPCWNWQGITHQQGYGIFNIVGAACRAHRFAYTRLVGPIPDGLTLDHLCLNKRCVNPAHLEPVTLSENSRRGTITHPTYLIASAAAARAQRAATHCRKGHEFNSENTSWTEGYRRCRTCMRAKNSRSKEAARERSGAGYYLPSEGVGEGQFSDSDVRLSNVINLDHAKGYRL